jgi:molybdopterin-synthase adenylyltransferase
MESARDFLSRQSEEGLVSWRVQTAAALRFGIPVSEAERTILEAGLLPARYQRNRETFSSEQQLRLFKSRVAVVGCGGLGGYVIEELARVGVGEIAAIDPDIFVEHNLNRQILSSPNLIDVPKVKAAVDRVAEINPAVTIIPIREALGPLNGGRLVAGAHVAVDALDNVVSRLDLAQVCREGEIPLVHGAIGGWYGQVLTQFPGDRSIERLYAGREEGTGAEKRLGNPSFTPAVIASLEAAETCKLLLGIGEPLRNRHLVIDLLSMEIHTMDSGVYATMAEAG